MMNEPYFMKNKEWYTETRDENGWSVYKLTSKAPKKAVESFNAFVAPDAVHVEGGGILEDDLVILR